MPFPRSGAAARRVLGNGVIEKVCGGCKRWLPLDSYHKNSTTRDGHQAHCKECQRIACRPYAAAQAWRKFDRQVERYVREYWPRLKRKDRT